MALLLMLSRREVAIGTLRTDGVRDGDGIVIGGGMYCVIVAFDFINGTGC